MSVSTNELEKTDVECSTEVSQKGWFGSVVLSIVLFLTILLVLAIFFPLDSDTKTKTVFFIAISSATAILLKKFPDVLVVKKMSLMTIVVAVSAGCTLPLLSLIAPVNSRYIDNFVSLSPSQQVAYVVFAWVLFPVVEETYFRGLLLPILESRLGLGIGSVLTILLFVFYHMRPYGLAGLAVQGFIYTWLKHREGSVAPCIVAHSVHNCSLLIIANLRVI